MASAQQGSPQQPEKREFNVTCFADENKATFICTNCQRPYCDQCLGKTIDDDKYCLECSALEQVRRSAPKKTQVEKKTAPAFAGPALALLALILMGVNAYLLLEDDYISVPANAGPEIPTQLSELIECKRHLQEIAASAAAFREHTGTYPTFIEQLQPISGYLPNEPVTGKPYEMTTDNRGGWSVHCPSPEAHGIAELIAKPGKPARVIYMTGEGEQP